jgi:hypothetical protein
MGWIVGVRNPDRALIIEKALDLIRRHDLAANNVNLCS